MFFWVFVVFLLFFGCQRKNNPPPNDFFSMTSAWPQTGEREGERERERERERAHVLCDLDSVLWVSTVLTFIASGKVDVLALGALPVTSLVLVSTLTWCELHSWNWSLTTTRR